MKHPNSADSDLDTCWLIRLLCFLIIYFIPNPAGAVFTNVTGAMAPTIGGGKVAWGDYNNDGFVDISVVGAVHLNNGGNNFTPMGGITGSSGIWGDYDNDGFLDFFSYDIATLYHNDGGTGFSQVSLPAGIAPVSRGASWADHNNDGFLDLYVTGFEGAGYYADVILQNNQGTSFTNVWTQPNDSMIASSSPRPGRGVTSADFDRDGDIDVYVSNYRIEPNSLLVNDGSGNFTDEATALGALGGTANGHWSHTIGSAWGDIDNDGELDIFVGNFAHPAGFSGPLIQPESRFLRNRGSGNPIPADDYTFQDMGQGGVGWQESYATPTLGDYDNDGDLDLFFTTVYSSNAHRLYRNDGNFSFTDVTASMGLSGLVGGTNSVQAGFADWDNDGDLDLLTHGFLYENGGNSNHWLKLNMVGDGQTINRDAVGAQVRIQVGGETYTRQVELGTGEGNQNDPTLHFGLGGQTGTVDIDVFWPDGTTRQITGLAVDQQHTINYLSVLDQYQWVTPGGGSWHTTSNWSPNANPNGNSVHAMLTGATASVANIDVSQSTTVAAIDISGSTDYQITDLSGTASLELQIDTQLFFGQNVSISVLAGNHVFDIPVNAGSDTDIVVSSGASLSLDESFDFNGMTVTKSGAGTLYVNNDTVSGSGILNVSSGMLSGTGHVNGDVFVTGGVVAPGQSVGNLDIAGDFALESNATLQIEIASLASKDFLFVDDGAVLSGTLDIELIGGYQPNHGDQFLIMIADSITDLGLTIDAEDSRDFTYSVQGNTLTLTSIVPPTPQWVGGASGDWNTAANWSPAAVPDSNDATVNLTGAAFPATAIQLDSSVMVRKLNVDNSSSFEVSGSGTMQLDDLLNQAEVAVAGGDHNLNVDLQANVNATFDIAAGASLSLDDTFGFDAVTVTKLGTGTLTINSDTVSGSGTLQLVDGTLAGTGHVNGDLVVTGGVLAPGQSVGRLDVTGDLTMNLNSTLQIEIASLSSKDLLSVDGNAILSGTLDIELVGGYQPNGGDQFLIMIANSFFDNELTLSGPDADNFQLNFLGNALLLEALASVLPGDYDGDGIVAGGDFFMWQNTLGDSVPIGTAADGDGSGVIDQADLAIWTSNYGTSSLAASSSSAAVPEPASSTLLLGMVIVVAARAQRRHRCGSGRGVVPAKLRLSAGFCRA